jgi:hypothetical protein
MTKIKNYRINLRAREVIRLLKNEQHLPATPELEVSVDAALKRWKSLVQPAAVYTTLTRATAEKTTSIAFPEKSVAVSILAATIGAGLSCASTEAASEGPVSEAVLLHAVAQEALQQAVQFGVKLLLEQAKEEECTLSALVQAEDGNLVNSLSSLLGTARIGIEPQGEGSALPPYARLIWVFWTPAAKSSSRKADTPSKQKAAA